MISGIVGVRILPSFDEVKRGNDDKEPDEKDDLSRMANALRSGAKMLSEHCPVCGSPIFEIKGELWCLKCNKRVIKIKSEEEIGTALSVYTLMDTASIIASKIEELTILLSREIEVDQIRKLSETLNVLLKTLEQTLKVRKMLKEEEI